MRLRAKPKMKYLGLDGVQVGLGSKMTNLTRRGERDRESPPCCGRHSRPHVHTYHGRGEAAEPALQPRLANGSESFRLPSYVR